jgi:hypothetical protein
MIDTVFVPRRDSNKHPRHEMDEARHAIIRTMEDVVFDAEDEFRQNGPGVIFLQK